MRTRLYQVPLLITALLLSLAARAAEDGAGFVSLFNGTDLSGWTVVGPPDAFTVKDGCIYGTGASPYPNWLRSEKTYENFILRFEYKTEGWYEGGFLFHAPPEGPASKMGLKMHIRHYDEPYGMRSTGAIYDAAAPLQMANHPSGEWNRCEIRCDWPSLQITMNDTVIQDLNMEENPLLRDRLRRGHLGIQGIGNRASFRDLQIKELPNREEWVNLFEKGMDAFRPVEGTEWSLENGVLTGKGKNGFLVTRESFSGPFELQVWVKSQINGNGGVHLYWEDKGHGIETQVFNSPDSTNPTGSFYNIAPAKEVVSRDEEWFLMQILADGPRASTLINGTEVTSTDKLPPPHEGPVGFQQHTDGMTIWYKDAKIKKR